MPIAVLTLAATGMQPLVAVLNPIIVIVAVALLLFWAVRTFLPEVYELARLIIGATALIFILIKLLPLL